MHSSSVKYWQVLRQMFLERLKVECLRKQGEGMRRRRRSESCSFLRVKGEQGVFLPAGLFTWTRSSNQDFGGTAEILSFCWELFLDRYLEEVWAPRLDYAFPPALSWAVAVATLIPPGCSTKQGQCVNRYWCERYWLWIRRGVFGSAEIQIGRWHWGTHSLTLGSPPLLSFFFMSFTHIWIIFLHSFKKNPEVLPLLLLSHRKCGVRSRMYVLKRFFSFAAVY